MKTSKLTASVLAAVLASATLVTGCSAPGSENVSSDSSSSSSSSSNAGGEQSSSSSAQQASKLEYADGTVLRMATGYNSKQTGLFFDADIAGSGIKLADGKTYNTGDLKPTWQEVEKVLNVKFENKYQGNNAEKEFTYWKEQLKDVDMISAKATQANENGSEGLLVNIAEYLDQMPNFKAYLDKNPIVRLSITGSVSGSSKGAIYFSPYFDGVDDIIRMPLMRTDWVQKLLDGDGEFTAASSDNTSAPVYKPFMPTTGKYEVEVVKKDGKSVEKVTKDYDTAGNIVQKMNDAGAMKGVDAVNMLRKYIDEAYNGYYGTSRSDLFVGQNAAWDVDEMVALLRCVTSNSATLNADGKKVQGLFSREDDNNQRRVDMVSFATLLFGVRGGPENSYLYIGNDNKLHDSRMEPEIYAALQRMNDLAKEGLLSESFVKESKESTATMLENDMGFMHYDYNQTQTVYNETKLQDGEKYMAAMVPVSRWNDGTGEKIVRFTESWRSVKDEGWVISKAGVGSDKNKLNAALALIDYAYSPKGTILMSYGPDAFIKTKADGSYETFMFNGEEWPVIADGTYHDLWNLETLKNKGNYTDFARQFLGSTMNFTFKSQAFEYQCTTPAGKEGAGYISNAIALGTIKHPELALASNPWYTMIPTVFPNTKVENDQISKYTEIGSKGYFSSSKGGVNAFVCAIAGGYPISYVATVTEKDADGNPIKDADGKELTHKEGRTIDGTNSAEETRNSITETWHGKQYLQYRQMAWEKLTAYYKELNG